MQLAEINIAQAKDHIDSALMQDFKAGLEAINQTAEHSPGFIWRLKDDSGHSSNLQYFNDPLLLTNMSVWQNAQALKDFMFKSDHISFFKRKSEWFNKMDSASYVLWWVEDGHIPTVEEAMQRLNYLRANGDSPYAFSFKQLFTSDDWINYEKNALPA